jgi:hypothetical protein
MKVVALCRVFATAQISRTEVAGTSGEVRRKRAPWCRHKRNTFIVFRCRSRQISLTSALQGHAERRERVALTLVCVVTRRSGGGVAGDEEDGGAEV